MSLWRIHVATRSVITLSHDQREPRPRRAGHHGRS
jgi:hypothetical protein